MCPHIPVTYLCEHDTTKPDFNNDVTYYRMVPRVNQTTLEFNKFPNRHAYRPNLLSLQPAFDHFFREDKLTSDSVETCLMLLPCNELKGRHVPHASVFICKRTFIFSVFWKVRVCTVRFLIIFARRHEKVKVTENGTIFGGSIHIYWYLRSWRHRFQNLRLPFALVKQSGVLKKMRLQRTGFSWKDKLQNCET